MQRSIIALSVTLAATVIAGRSAVAAPANVEKFIDEHVEDARAVNTRWGLPTSLVLAISGLESGWGANTHGANVYFGVTTPCSSVVDESTVVKTNPVVNGKRITLCFVKYASFRDAAMGMARNLCSPRIYSAAVKYAVSTHSDPSEFDVDRFIDLYTPVYCPGCTAYAATVKSARRWTQSKDSEALPVCRENPEPAAAEESAASSSSSSSSSSSEPAASTPEPAEPEPAPAQPPAGDSDTSE
jgi:flagellum-specific peptidoglycan hydrolase FlgJ